jgi:putative endonuclease
MIAKGGFTYIMTNKNNTTLYVGVCSEIKTRVMEHKEKFYPKSFTARYNLNKLVYFEFHDLIDTAIEREKQLKAGNRKKKIDLINSINPDWRDLWDDLKEW